MTGLEGKNRAGRLPSPVSTHACHTPTPPRLCPGSQEPATAEVCCMLKTTSFYCSISMPIPDSLWGDQHARLIYVC